jgi:GT2 family glycosyltransferase
MATKIIDYEVSEPLPALDGVEKYDYLRLHLFRGERAIGKFTMRTGKRPVKREDVATQFAQYCLDQLLTRGADLNRDEVTQALVEQLVQSPESRVRSPESKILSTQHSALSTYDPGLRTLDSKLFQTTLSIIIPTCDRPADLERCLSSLLALKSRHQFEIIVVDNRPASGLSKTVAERFPVKYVAEARPGASYARNAGVAHSSGEIMVFTDDDAKVTANWLDNLVAPFIEPEVMCVSGLVLPAELETYSQELYERYGAGGLERGFERRKLGLEFFNHWKGAVQTWQLGGTANCAIRAEVFMRREMGPFEESLGPGTPAGVGEDTYMFYRILRAGYYCVYEPAALVYHTHRRTLDGLRKQLFSYSKGAVGQQIRCLMVDKDRRALVQMLKILPQWHWRRIKSRVFGWDTFPLHIILLEICGNLLGVPGYFQSLARVKKLGRYSPAQIAAERAKAGPLLATAFNKKELSGAS